MKKLNILLAAGAMAAAAIAIAPAASAQDAATETVVVEEDVVVGQTVECKPRYYTSARDNWFIQLGAGINTPLVENSLIGGDASRHITAAYNLGFGKWFSPYIGWRMSFLGGALHWDNNVYSKSKYVNANVDIMWDMFNSLGGVNTSRVFSIVPFAGIGGTYVWDFKGEKGNILNGHGRVKNNQWCLPVSAGLQLRFRLSPYVDFFAEARAQFYGDNFNNYAYDKPIDVNITTVGGFTFHIGGSGFKTFNPCDYLSYIDNLNRQVNSLRGDLAACGAALAAAEAQLPCPEVVQAEEVTVENNLMSVVRFRINSAKIRPEEQVNIFNIANWMKSNPSQNVTIVGYADKDTGTSGYNMKLSERRAQAVKDALVNVYGINPDRLSVSAQGSDSQPYPDNNNWNRIVIFNAL